MISTEPTQAESKVHFCTGGRKGNDERGMMNDELKSRLPFIHHSSFRVHH
jgi:hypothetical protein